MRLGYWLATLPTLVAGADLLSALAELPDCGLQCFTSSVASSSCSTLTDAACICADTVFLETAQACVLQSCSVREALEIAKIEAVGCDRPVRNRRNELFIPLAIEVPAWICPWLRVYSRWTSGQLFALDDYLMLACGVFYSVFLVLGAVTGQRAFGVDTWMLEPNTVTEGLKLFYVDESLYLACLCLTKVSMLFFYLRIFPNRKFWYAAYGAMAFVIVPTITFIFMQIFQCIPVSYIWEGWIEGDQEHKCLNLNILVYTAASFSIAQDVVILILPLPLLYRLHIGLKSKAGIMFMFSLGIFVLATSCVRLRYIISFGHTTNPSWDYSDPLIWTGLETAVSVIVACLPSIRVLINRMMPGVVMTVMSRPPHGYVKEGSSPSSTAAVSTRRREGQRGNIFSSNADGEEHESQIELGLRLGDKAHGDVQTEIMGGPPGSIRKEADAGIRVMTTLTTDVDHNSLRGRRAQGVDMLSRTPDSSTPGL